MANRKIAKELLEEATENTESTEITLRPEQEAVVLTERIKANGRAAVNAVCNIGKDLRRMKIENLFVHLGYQSFEEYAEKEFDLQRRQAYLYISVYEKLGEDFVQSNAHLGITKLALLAQANYEDRAEVLENADVESMSTRELKELLDKCKVQGEQLSLLEEENKRLSEESELDRKEQENANAAAQKYKELYKRREEEQQRLEDRVKSLEDKLKEKEKDIINLNSTIEELESTPKDVEVAEKEVIKEVPDTKALEKKDKEITKLQNSMKKLEQAQAAKEKELAEQKAAYETKIAELQKSAEQPDKTTFKAIFASAYKEFTGLVEFIKAAEEQDKPVFIERTKNLLVVFSETLEGVEAK